MAQLIDNQQGGAILAAVPIQRRTVNYVVERFRDLGLILGNDRGYPSFDILSMSDLALKATDNPQLIDEIVAASSIADAVDFVAKEFGNPIRLQGVVLNGNSRAFPGSHNTFAKDLYMATVQLSTPEGNPWMLAGRDSLVFVSDVAAADAARGFQRLRIGTPPQHLFEQPSWSVSDLIGHHHSALHEAMHVQAPGSMIELSPTVEGLHDLAARHLGPRFFSQQTGVHLGSEPYERIVDARIGDQYRGFVEQTAKMLKTGGARDAREAAFNIVRTVPTSDYKAHLA